MGKNDIPLLKVKNVKKHFGHFPALRGISFDLSRGEFLSIVGPNGAGKTTLLNCLSMVMRPASGDVFYNGRNIYDEAESFRRKLGYISHSLFLYGELTGFENLKFYSRLYGIDPHEDKIDSLLHSLGILQVKNQPVRTYSRGMKQRLAIARAILHRPEIVFLDEPFTGLDQHASSVLTDLLLKQKTEGKTVILISHQLKHALQMGDRVLIIVKGKIRSELKATDLSEEDFRKHYIEVVSRVGGEA